MANIILFVFFILNSLLGLLSIAIIAAAILSWLVAFNVVNPRNGFVYQVMAFLEAVTRPVLYPVQRMIPSLGGVDISPIIVLLLISGIRSYLLPALMSALLAAVPA
ncbi:MAG: YggT family protein [Caulobacteraceae bacterium]